MNTVNEMPVVSNSGAGVRHDVKRGLVTIDREPYVGEFQKEGTKTVQLRQVITTTSYYPSKKVESSLNGGLFDLSDFGFEETEYTNEENRVAWIMVPANTTAKQLKEKLATANKNGCCIYRVLANEPILDENQLYAISSGQRTKDDFADKQVVRYSEDHEEEELQGKLCLDANNNVQYRKTYFWGVDRNDFDARSVDTAKHYISENIEAELQGAASMAGQSL
jgi:hypothetical protein